jgi:hypothetical protein
MPVINGVNYSNNALRLLRSVGLNPRDGDPATEKIKTDKNNDGTPTAAELDADGDGTVEAHEILQNEQYQAVLKRYGITSADVQEAADPEAAGGDPEVTDAETDVLIRKIGARADYAAVPDENAAHEPLAGLDGFASPYGPRYWNVPCEVLSRFPGLSDAPPAILRRAVVQNTWVIDAEGNKEKYEPSKHTPAVLRKAGATLQIDLMGLYDTLKSDPELKKAGHYLMISERKFVFLLSGGTIEIPKKRSDRKGFTATVKLKDFENNVRYMYFAYDATDLYEMSHNRVVRVNPCIPHVPENEADSSNAGNALIMLKFPCAPTTNAVYHHLLQNYILNRNFPNNRTMFSIARQHAREELRFLKARGEKFTPKQEEQFLQERTLYWFTHFYRNAHVTKIGNQLGVNPRLLHTEAFNKIAAQYYKSFTQFIITDGNDIGVDRKEFGFWVEIMLGKETAPTSSAGTNGSIPTNGASNSTPGENYEYPLVPTHSLTD